MFSLSAAGLLPLLSLIPSARAFCGHRLPHHTLYRRQEGNASIPAEMEAEKPAFGYGIADGPLNWAHLSADFSLCATGMRQSPILLDQSFLSAGPGSVRLDMPIGTDVVFENLGTTVEVVASGTLQAADDPTNSTWDLAQFHFHTPSEHRVNLAHADGEMHMVFKSAADPNQIAVVAFMIEMSADATTPMLETAFAQLNEIAEEGSSTTIPILDFSEFLAGVPEQSFFRYGGSLTTPPCSETVEWYVAEKAIPLSVAAYRSLRTSTKANKRNTQNAPGQPSVLTLAAEGGIASAAGLSEFVVDAGVPAAEVQNASESAQAETAVPAVENLAEATPLSESITNPPASAATAVAVVAASAPGVRHNPLVPVKRMRRIR